MAAIHDLLIRSGQTQNQTRAGDKQTVKNKNSGLVFEEHLQMYAAL
ncbi:MAG: hypothetical protein ACLRPV_05640 [Lacrimispora saccharolytica]